MDESRLRILFNLGSLALILVLVGAFAAVIRAVLD